MTVRYENTARDVRVFYFRHCSRSFALIGVLCFMLALLFVAVFLDLPSDLSPTEKVLTVLCSELTAIFFITVWVALVIFLAPISRRNKTILTEHTITLAEDVFTTETPYCRAEQKWAIVQKLVRTKNHIFIYVANSAAHVVPRRAFRDDQEWEAFYEFCRRKAQAAV